MNKQEVIQKLEESLKTAQRLYDDMEAHQARMREAIVMIFDALEEIK
jgi:hypothetical protein